MHRFGFIAPLTLLAVDVLAGPIYRCQDAGGAVSFSDRPCGPSAERLDIEIHRPSPEQQYEARIRAAENAARAAAEVTHWGFQTAIEALPDSRAARRRRASEAG